MYVCMYLCMYICMLCVFVCMRVCVHACVCSIRESILVQSSIQGMQECCSPSLSAQTVLQCLLELQHETAVSSLCPEECGWLCAFRGTPVPHACGLVLHVCGACMWVVCVCVYVYVHWLVCT